MKRYAATKDIVGQGLAINGQSAVFGSKIDEEPQFNSLALYSLFFQNCTDLTNSFFSSTGRECSYDTTAAVGHKWGEKSQSQSTFCLFRDFRELRSTLEKFANFSRMGFALSLSYFKSMGSIGFR